MNKTLASVAIVLFACGQRSPDRRCTSTVRARRFRTRSTPSGSPSTTSSTRTSRSTTSRSDRAAASSRSPRQTVFFGASDGPMTDEQLKAVARPILHFPTVLGGVVPVYNIPGVSAELKFTGPVLADIFLGKITKWNDPAIAKLNPGVKLPATDITVVHRSDGSGTTYIWVDYLSKVSPEWKDQGRRHGVGQLAGGRRRQGQRRRRRARDAERRARSATSSSSTRCRTRSPMAACRMRPVEFVKASVPAVTAAAAGAAAHMPADFRVSITNAPGKGAYPISSFTWLLLYESNKDGSEARTMVDFVKWALTDGQKFCAGLGYAPLPPNVVKLEMAALTQIKGA